MSTTIICPNCQHEFEPNDAFREQLRSQMSDWQKKKEEEFKKKEAEHVKQAQEQARKEAISDSEVQIKLLQQTNADNEAKLKLARDKEVEFLKQQQALKAREEEIELEVQQKILREREQLKEVLHKEIEERNKLKDHEHFLKVKELEKQLEDQKMLTEEMKRKQEQGSMQLQGEVQELALEELLRATFPFDVVEEVGKGVRGADCIQIVRNNFGQECGKIIYESKRTKDFSNEWIEKLKADMRNLGADIAIIVTQAMPKDMEGFGEKDGVWICNFLEARSVATIMRDLILRVYSAGKNNENKGDKMALLYNYLISSEFAEQWKAIREGFMSMKISVQKEREQMEKLWKAREKQLEKVLLNAAHIRGSIEGIAGMDSVDMNLDTPDNGYLLD
jgi:hypothetical protein